MWDLTPAALQRLGTLFINFYKQKLQEKIYPYAPGYNRSQPTSGKSNKVASGQLLNSLTATVVENKPGQYELVITYMDYFEAVNLGRRPRRGKVPIPALLDWIKIRGIKGRNKRGRFIPNLSLAFAIQTNIYKYGIVPSNIYDKAYDSFEALLENPPAQFQQEYEALYEAIGQDVENFMDKVITKEFPSIIEI
jgi:DNA-binding ferritin-like protein (Dps family)